MKLSLHITTTEYLSDYLDMGVEMFVIAGEFGTYTTEHLTIDELKALKKRVPLLYVLVNGLYDEHELEGLFAHIDALANIGVDGILFQDFGVLQYVKEKGYSFDMMYQPQTLNTNPLTLNALKEEGITSASVANVISLDEQLALKEKAELPLMIQAHGVQYMMSSKRELISNYEDAAKKTVSHVPGALVIKPQGVGFDCYVYEDNRGTTIYSKTRLYTLDLLKTMSVFDYLYIETLFMESKEAIEVVNAYAEALNNVSSPLFGKYVKEYLPILKNVSKPLDRGFIEDGTIYHLEDVKRRDRLEGNK